MIVGIGTDIVDVKRVRLSVARFGDRFTDKILSPVERRSLLGDPLASYVARQFAAKEAVSKALGTGMRNGVYFTNIEVTRNENGAPVVTLSGGARMRAEELGVNSLHISLSDEREFAIAYVIATSDA